MFLVALLSLLGGQAARTVGGSLTLSNSAVQAVSQGQSLNRPGSDGGSQSWEGMMRVMAAPRKYSVELRDRAIRMALDARQDPETRTGAIKRIADQLGVHPEALRTWVRQAEVDDGVRPGTTSDDATRIGKLEREVRELRRANEILRTSAAFFAAAELDRKIK